MTVHPHTAIPSGLFMIMVDNMLAYSAINFSNGFVVFQERHVIVKYFKVTPFRRAGLRHLRAHGKRLVDGLHDDGTKPFKIEFVVARDLPRDGQHVIGEIGSKHSGYVKGFSLFGGNCKNLPANCVCHLQDRPGGFAVVALNEHRYLIKIDLSALSEGLQRIKNARPWSLCVCKLAQGLTTRGMQQYGALGKDDLAGYCRYHIILNRQYKNL